jgi:hypothetical protein
MKYLFLLMFGLGLCGCIGCGGQNDDPHVIVQSDISYCGQYCDKVTQMNCVGYFEAVNMPLSDGGNEVLSCKDFCEYELNNGVPLHPKCIYENLKDCSEIESICKDSN